MELFYEVFPKALALQIVLPSHHTSSDGRNQP